MSKCSIIFLLRYNQDGNVKGKQDNARNNDIPYNIYFKPIWYQENYLLRHKQFRQSHFSLKFIIGIVSEIVCRTFSTIRIPAPCFFYPGSVGCSAMCAVYSGHNHLFLKINVCNFLVKILRIKHHNSSFLIHHNKENKQTYMSRKERHLNTFNPAGSLCTL